MILYRAETTEGGEVVEGYYIDTAYDHRIFDVNYTTAFISNMYYGTEIKPETLQIKLSNGEWCNVDDTEVVRKDLSKLLSNPNEKELNRQVKDLTTKKKGK